MCVCVWLKIPVWVWYYFIPIFCPVHKPDESSICKTDPTFFCMWKRSTKQIFNQWITRFGSNTVSSMQWNKESSVCFIHSYHLLHWLPAENDPIEQLCPFMELKSQWNIPHLLFLMGDSCILNLLLSMVKPYRPVTFIRFKKGNEREKR